MKTRLIRNNCRKAGFTLLETIVASVILCSAVVVIAGISSDAMVNTRLNRQYEVAARLIDQQLSLIDYMGVEQFIDMDKTEGKFGEGQPVFTWRIKTRQLSVDNLYAIEVEVGWTERGRNYSVVMNTRLDGKGEQVEMPMPKPNSGSNVSR